MIYLCGTGDQQFAGVFSYINDDTAPPTNGPNTWTSACYQGPYTYYAHNHLTTTQTKTAIQNPVAMPETPEVGEISFDPSVSPNASVSWIGSASEYEWYWTNDGVAITSPGRDNATSTEQLVVSNGVLCIEVRAVDGNSLSEPGSACTVVNPIPVLPFMCGRHQLVLLLNTRQVHAVLAEWPSIEHFAEVQAIDVTVDGVIVESLHKSTTQYLVTGLDPDTEYDVGVYARGYWPFPQSVDDREEPFGPIEACHLRPSRF